MTNEEYLLLESKYRNMIHKMANKFHCDGLDREDFVQEMRIALFRAGETHDPSRGASLSTHAWNCMYRRGINLFRKSQRQVKIATDAELHGWLWYEHGIGDAHSFDTDPVELIPSNAYGVEDYVTSLY